MTINSIFIKLLLRNKTYWASRLNLHSKVVIKSFYKNSELLLLNSMKNINALLLETINSSLNSYSFINQILLFSLLHNNLLSKYYVSNTKYVKSDNVSYMSSNSSMIIPFNFDSTSMLSNHNTNILYHLIFSVYVNILNVLNSKFLHNFDWTLSKLPKHSYKYTVLRSPHIDKKSREQIEILTHKSLISGLNLLSSYSIDYIKNKSNSEYIEYMY